MSDVPVPAIGEAARRRLAADLFNHVWALLDTEGRTPEQDVEMIHAAHASRHHWGEVGTPVNVARGEWQISRVYATLGRGERHNHLRSALGRHANAESARRAEAMAESGCNPPGAMLRTQSLLCLLCSSHWGGMHGSDRVGRRGGTAGEEPVDDTDQMAFEGA